jgi:two-component sensor histidine kinase
VIEPKLFPWLYYPARLANEIPFPSSDAVRAVPRRWRWALLFGVWTLFAAGVAWWLIHSTGSGNFRSDWIFDSSQTSQIPIGEQIRRWLKLADFNFRGAYPWVLLAPYVFWLGSRFHLERGRLRICLSVHIAGCALFAAASHSLTRHTNAKAGGVAVAYGASQGVPFPWQLLTNPAASTLEITSGVSRISIQTYTSQVAGAGAKVMMSSSAGTKPLSINAPTDENAAISNRLRRPGIWSAAPLFETATNLSTAAGRISDQSPEPGPMLKQAPLANSRSFSGGGGGGGGGAYSSRQYVSPSAFSHLLNVLAYGSLVGLAHTVHFYRRFREREQRTILLESHLAKAQLHALQAQLHPHFLFNALNAIATLLRRDASAALEMLTSLSELLRLALSQSNKQEISLRDDLQFLERYVEIQQTRLGDRFRFEPDVDPTAMDCLVPALLLQPLVENAFRHGIELSSHPGVVRVIVRRLNGQLTLTVEDNGAGLAKTGEDRHGTGIGLSNLRARLQALYGNRQKVELGSRPEGGVTVRIEIPAREITAAEEASRWE